MSRHSTRVKHRLMNANLLPGLVYYRFWRINSKKKQGQLFDDDLSKKMAMTTNSIIIDGKRVVYDAMDSKQPNDPGYQVDPYKAFSDREFLGFGLWSTYQGKT